MDIFVWILAGALTGVLLNMLLRQNPLSEFGSIMTGAAAAVVGGYVIAPALGLAEVGDLNLVGLVVALMCAVVGLSIAGQYREDA